MYRRMVSGLLYGVLALVASLVGIFFAFLVVYHLKRLLYRTTTKGVKVEDKDAYASGPVPWSPGGYIDDSDPPTGAWDLPSEPQRKKTRKKQANIAGLITSCGIVAVIFALSVAVVWCLTKIGPIAAQVDVSVKKFGILITATGLFGGFFAIALLGFGAIYVFSGRR